MALFSECMLECARKVLDTADIVREAISQQLTDSRDYSIATELVCSWGYNQSSQEMAEHTTRIAPQWLIFLLFAACTATAQDRQGSERRLQADYVGKYWVLKGFYEGQDLAFGTDGTLLRGEPPQSWTLAGVEVTALKLHDTDVEIDGKRVAYVYDPGHARFIHRYRVVRCTEKGADPADAKLGAQIQPRPEGQYRIVHCDEKSGIETVKITLQSPASADEASLRQALEGVLIPDADNLPPGVPEYWRGFLDSAKPPPLSSFNVPDGPVYRVGNDVTAPQPISTPDPQYAEPARRAKFQGDTLLFAIVDRSGRTVDVRVARPLGFGLDEQAVETVRHWTFKPAERNGEPVAVMMNVTVRFRLY